MSTYTPLNANPRQYARFKQKKRRESIARIKSAALANWKLPATVLIIATFMIIGSVGYA